MFIFKNDQITLLPVSPSYLQEFPKISEVSVYCFIMSGEMTIMVREDPRKKRIPGKTKVFENLGMIDNLEQQYLGVELFLERGAWEQEIPTKLSVLLSNVISPEK